LLEPISPAFRLSLPHLNDGGRRTLAISLVVLIEVLMLIMLLSLSGKLPNAQKSQDATVVELSESEEEAVTESRPERAPSAEAVPEPSPRERPPTPAEPSPATVETPPPLPPVPSVLPTPFQLPPAAAVPRNSGRPAAPSGPVYGPVDRGTPAYLRDTERVGTAPNGEPLYAAAWYREPREEMLRDYLATASGPGWGLIACRTAPDYRAEYPENSQINRAILAAAWEFKVRPPRRGGQPLVGSWVRIRIDWQRR
jgi:protein TonB